MSQPAIFYEKGQIKPKQRRELESAGYVLVVVPDINKIKTVGELPATPENDGFNLCQEEE